MNKRQVEFVAKVQREFPAMNPEKVVSVCSDLIKLSTFFYELTEESMNRPLYGWEKDVLDRGIHKDFGRVLMPAFDDKCSVGYSTFYCYLVVPSDRSDFMGCPGLCIPPDQEGDEE